ncbi:N-acetylmuramoyl-L-alanine amidase [Antarcticimicrobium sediminis]|uniref:N-acetylmuramoyl-L-alanine amidase n=1 Tax=Antarcticimicrobium sediminis TaxID=2546227 RepID=A0A4R5EHP0_9RHOB|nr:N-acetylmuramoyl-L-alanine amidase [Antarcticimicrobium sediminis]TDE33822.1 N-acetylmuramoyl-L-alanine amidase [Antarcticimicrobium sediminis]
MTPHWHPSPNFGDRRNALQPALVVLHYTAMAGAGAALARLCDPEAEVSSHYLIGADGTLWQMVREADRAWHAGAGTWCGLEDINSRSIGIELDNRGDHPFSEPQMATLEALLPEIMARWGIGPAGVIGHSDMAPGRKCDPGPRFDWARLARLGLALPHAPQSGCAIDPEGFRAMALRAGYPTEATEADLLSAVRHRVRPWGRGPLTQEDMDALAGFVAAHEAVPA